MAGQEQSPWNPRTGAVRPSGRPASGCSSADSTPLDTFRRPGDSDEWLPGGSAGSGEVGPGDAVGMAVWPLEHLDPVAVRVGDPAGPRPGGTAGILDRLGLDPFGGKIGACCVQRLGLDDQVVDAGAGTRIAFC